jgi:hypothetical protein
MPLASFNPLLRILRKSFGEAAWPEAAPVADPIRGRFNIDPFQVPTPPAENGLSVTQIWFFYDARRDLPANMRAPKQGDFLVIRGIRYEVADVQVDDLGENGLQLLRASQDRPPFTWDDGATTWQEADGSRVEWQ